MKTPKQPATPTRDLEPVRDARAFVRANNASARAWERTTDGALPQAVRVLAESRHIEQGDKAEDLAKAYGCAIDWPGLFPVLKHEASGREHYSTADFAATVSFFLFCLNLNTKAGQ